MTHEEWYADAQHGYPDLHDSAQCPVEDCHECIRGCLGCGRRSGVQVVDGYCARCVEQEAYRRVNILSADPDKPACSASFRLLGDDCVAVLNCMGHNTQGQHLSVIAWTESEGEGWGEE